MPAVARGDSVDAVQAPHGTGPNCASPEVYSTDKCSSNVFVNGIGVVRENDAMISHSTVGCTSHAPLLLSFSSKVYVNGKRMGRVGDEYIGDGNHPIISGSSNVVDGSPKTS